MSNVSMLLITGPAGIGKSTLCWEIGKALEEAEIAHAIIESDELDRVYPKPGREALERLRPGATDISELNLAALWSTYQALGHTRAIMSGVMMHPSFDRGWILRAIPDAELVFVRLEASETTLRDRIERREVGSAAEEQLQRSLRQSQRMAAESNEPMLRVTTDGKTPRELAETILRATGWVA